MIERLRNSAGVIWSTIVVLVALWTVRMMIESATSVSEYISPGLAFALLTIVSLPLCVPPLILGWVGLKRHDARIGFVGLVWLLGGVAILEVKYGISVLP